MSQNGKGDKPRPMLIDSKTWDKNWNQIFRKKKSEKNRNGNSKRVSS